MTGREIGDRHDPSVQIARREHSAALRQSMIDAGVIRPGDISGLRMDHGPVLPLDEMGRAWARREIQTGMARWGVKLEGARRWAA